MNPIKWFVTLAIGMIAGCAVEEAHWDEARLREYAIAYYSDQIMDNLVRAKNGQLFLHVNINNLQAVVTSELAGSVGGGNTSTDMRNRQLTNQRSTATTNNGANLTTAVAALGAAVGTISRTAVSPFTYSVAPKRSDQLTYASVPETNDPDLYQAYLQFLNVDDEHPSLYDIDENYELRTGNDVKSVVKKQPGETLVEGDSNPNKREPPNAVHYVPGTLKRCNNGTYYVPIRFKNAYFQLCMAISGRISLPAKGPVSYTGGTPSRKKPSGIKAQAAVAAAPSTSPATTPPGPEVKLLPEASPTAAESGTPAPNASPTEAATAQTARSPSPEAASARPRKKPKFLRRKNETEEERQLKILQQKLDSLNARP